MDISTLVESSRTIDITHPATHDPTGIQVEILPMTSERVQAVKRRHENEVYRTRFRGFTAEKSEAQKLEILVAAINGWTWGGNTSFEGAKPECTPENVRRVFRKLPWFRSQVDAALGEEAEFFRSDDGAAD